MTFDDILIRSAKPGRYTGTEINARKKNWNDAAFTAALIFPDLYEIGMSHLGLHILYHVTNDMEGVLADRAYCPDTDLEALLRKNNKPLWGVETRRPLGEFDLLAITLPYELCYSNIFTILDLSGVPLWSRERNDASWPVLIAGGSGSVHAEPVAEIFDAILVGDGEEALPEIINLVREWRETNGDKRELLDTLTTIEGVYVPRLYRPRFDKNGVFAELRPLAPHAGRVRRRIISDLDQAAAPTRPLVPHVRIVHDRLGVEIARGCTRGCRFCQAGITYRPVRERSPANISPLIREALCATGWEELSMLSLSTGDYSCLEPLLSTVMDRLTPEHISVSLPSLRVGTLTPAIMAQIKRVRKTGFTLAPEAGSDRLRRVINKGITEQDLLDTAAQAYGIGWNNMKLYFMIGLPTETREDVLEIGRLARKVLASGGKRRGRKVTVSVGTFVPKPHTPFQWERQISENESRQRLNLLKNELREKAIDLRWHDPAQSFLEGVFSRGDRKLSKVIHRAWKMGARLDAWGDRLNIDLYRRAACEEGIDLERYLDSRDVDALLPWDHISTGVKRSFLLEEREKAMKETFTADCRRGDCQACGVCDFKLIKPVVHEIRPSEKALERIIPWSRKPTVEEARKASSQQTEERFTYKVAYSKLADARFLGHLEMVRVFHRAARRAGLPLVHSRGFHPMPRLSFGQPIALGTESLEEEMTIVLSEPVRLDTLRSSLNRELPKGLRISEAALSDGKTPLQTPPIMKYLLALSDLPETKALSCIERLNAASFWPVERTRKGKTAVVDIKETVARIELIRSPHDRDRLVEEIWPAEIEPGSSLKDWTYLRLDQKTMKMNNLKPSEIAGAVFGLNDDEARMTRILKLGRK